jgi:hypothetical protein
MFENWLNVKVELFRQTLGAIENPMLGKEDIIYSKQRFVV